MRIEHAPCGEGEPAAPDASHSPMLANAASRVDEEHHAEAREDDIEPPRVKSMRLRVRDSRWRRCRPHARRASRPAWNKTLRNIEHRPGATRSASCRVELLAAPPMSSACSPGEGADVEQAVMPSKRRSRVGCWASRRSSHLLPRNSVQHWGCRLGGIFAIAGSSRVSGPRGQPLISGCALPCDVERRKHQAMPLADAERTKKGPCEMHGPSKRRHVARAIREAPDRWRCAGSHRRAGLLRSPCRPSPCRPCHRRPASNDRKLVFWGPRRPSPRS